MQTLSSTSSWPTWYRRVPGNILCLVTFISTFVSPLRLIRFFRTNEFYRLEASGLIASVIGPALTSALMQRNLWLPMLLGLAIMFMGTCMASIIPEKSINLQDSIHLTTDSVGLDEPLPTEPAITGRWKANADTLKSTLRTMTQNKQVVLLLCISFTAQLGAGSRELLLQYVSKRYDWTFARVGLLSLYTFPHVRPREHQTCIPCP